MGQMTSRRALLLLATAAVLAAGCGGSDGSGTDVMDQGAPATSEVAASLPTDAISLPAMTPEGFSAMLADLRGTPVLVNVWASWCGPCNEEAPLLAEAHGRYGDRVQFIGVDILDTRGSARGFIAEHGWTWPSVYDADGDIRDALGVIGQPVTLFYDAEGTLIATWTGAIGADLLEENLRRIAG